MPLYKYLPPSRVDVLQRREIRFTQPGALNDPFEFRPVFHSVVPDSMVHEVLSEPLDLTPTLQEVYEELPSEFRAKLTYREFLNTISSHLDSPEGKNSVAAVATFFREGLRMLRPAADAYLARMAEAIGILSLTTDPNSTVMWAHYASSAGGFVLEFDETHEFFNRRRSDQDECYYLRPVLYELPKPAAYLVDLEGVDLFLRKHPSWSYESEIRMVAPLAAAARVVESQGDRIHLFSLPADCITGVILGSRIPAKVEAEIGNALAPLEWSHVKIYRSVPSEATQELRTEASNLLPYPQKGGPS